MDMDFSQECRLCGTDCTQFVDLMRKSAFRTWIDKTLNIQIDPKDEKSAFICNLCNENIRQWITFRTKFQKVQKSFEMLAEDASSSKPKPTGKEKRQQSRLDDYFIKNKSPPVVEVKKEVNSDGEEKEKKFVPLGRVKMEPKIEQDLFDTYGSTGINQYGQLKVECKAEPEDDKEEVKKKMENIQKRVLAIRHKFKMIGEREKRAKLLKLQKQAFDEARKKTREILPTKKARKSIPAKVASKKKAAAELEPDSEEEEEDTEKENEPKKPVRSTRKKAPVRYALGDDDNESDPDDPDEVDFAPTKKTRGKKPTKASEEKVKDVETSDVEMISDKEEEPEKEKEPEPSPAPQIELPVPKKPATKNRPGPLSKKKPAPESETTVGLKRKAPETTTLDETTEPQPAKKKCVPLSVRRKQEEAERLKREKESKERESSNSSGEKGAEEESEESSGSSEESSEEEAPPPKPAKKAKSLLDYYPKVDGSVIKD